MTYYVTKIINYAGCVSFYIFNQYLSHFTKTYNHWIEGGEIKGQSGAARLDSSVLHSTNKRSRPIA